jgi:hypothetical protein
MHGGTVGHLIKWVTLPQADTGLPIKGDVPDSHPAQIHPSGGAVNPSVGR